MNFHENLRFLMESKDIQIKELSQKTGISENTIKTYLRSASAEPKLSKAILIAKALDVTMEFLATGKEKDSPQALSRDFFNIQEDLKKLTPKDLKLVTALVKAMKE